MTNHVHMAVRWPGLNDLKGSIMETEDEILS